MHISTDPSSAHPQVRPVPDRHSDFSWPVVVRSVSRARSLIEPHGGRVVAEYFDIGQSRSLPWQRRPQAAALLDALADPARGFSAVVIGEPHRMFYGNQFVFIFPLFVHYGVDLWVPGLGGRIDPTSDVQDLMMVLFGGLSKAERNRIRIRVRASMAALTATEGRFLGGRPPYGYRLQEAGPHPHPAKAAAGMRLHYLVPDPACAPAVATIFEMFNAGFGYGAIVARLTREGFSCPSRTTRGATATAGACGPARPYSPSSLTPVTPAARPGRANGVTRCSST
jgi:site-specific DNA recombinase